MPDLPEAANRDRLERENVVAIPGNHDAPNAGFRRMNDLSQAPSRGLLSRLSKPGSILAASLRDPAFSDYAGSGSEEEES